MIDPRVRAALMRVLGRNRRRLTGFACWSLVETLPALASGGLLARAVDDGFLAGRVGTGFGWLAVLAVAVLVGAVATRRTYLLLAEVVEPFRDELSETAVRGTVHGSIRPGARPDRAGAARVTHQVDVVRETFAGLVMMAQGFVVVTAGALVGLATLAPLALVLVVPPVVVGVAIFVRAVPLMVGRERDLRRAEERIAATAHTLTAGMRDIVACGAEDRLVADAGRDVEAQAAAVAALARTTALRTVAVGIGGRLPLVLILVATPWLIANGATPGVVLGALTYVAQGVQPALQTLVHTVGDHAVTLLVTWGRILETDAEDHAGAGLPATRGTGSGRGDLELRRVSFAYGPAAQPVLHDLDLRIPDGDHLAVVGPSGIGKSTLAALLAGVLRPDAGAATLDGVPLVDWDGAALVARRVLIPQEAYVFAGSLRDNLAYLGPDVTDAQLDAAAATLGLAPLVDRLGGYAAHVEPDALSAGERQLVTLVRAYVSVAPLIVLDEATCHLDPAAEARVEEAFAARPGTLVVIAHRISSALRARRVLLLDGTAVALGTHHDLESTSSSYRELVGHWTPEGSAAGRPLGLR